MELAPLVRPARLSDVPEIATIHVSGYRGPAGPSYDRRLELWHHVLGGGKRRTRVWVALDGLGQVIGFAGAGAARVLRERYDGELIALYVAPAAERRGAGRALVREAMRWFGEAGFASAMAWVPEGSDVSGFFTKLGAVAADATRVVGGAREVAWAWVISDAFHPPDETRRIL